MHSQESNNLPMKSMIKQSPGGSKPASVLAPSDVPVICTPKNREDAEFIESEIKRLTSDNDLTRLHLVEVLKEQWPLGIGDHKFELTEKDRLNTLDDLENKGFDRGRLEKAGGYLLCLFRNICKLHVDDKEPPKRLNYSSPTKDDNKVRDALKRDASLIEMTWPEIATDDVDNSMICRDETSGWRPLDRSELKHPHHHVIDKTLCAIPPDRGRSGMEFLASKKRIHPLADTLQRCKRDYTGTDEAAIAIVENIAATYMNNEHPIPNMVLRNLLFTQAGLTMQDENITCPLFVPVLCGDQGTYKSSWWEVLATLGQPHLKHCYSVCSASPAHLINDITLRSTSAFMEIAETERYLTPSTLDGFKNLITDTHPIGRRPYDVAPTRFKRKSVWVGSSNHPTAVLVDRSSTYDRRIIPIWIPSGDFIDIDQMQARVSELWGAVMHLHEKGYCPTPQSIPPNLYGELGSYQRDFIEVTPKEQSLIDYARGVNLVDPSEACVRAFGLAERDVTATDVRDARNIYKATLPDMGFEETRIRMNGKRISVFKRAGDSRLLVGRIYTIRADINQGRSTPINWPVDDDENTDF